MTENKRYTLDVAGPEWSKIKVGGYDGKPIASLTKAEGATMEEFGALKRSLLDAFDIGVASAKPSLFGRERALINALTDNIKKGVNRRHPVTDPTEQARGSWFDVQITDDKNVPTGHVARVFVVLDRFESNKPLSTTLEEWLKNNWLMWVPSDVDSKLLIEHIEGGHGPGVCIECDPRPRGRG